MDAVDTTEDADTLHQALNLVQLSQKSAAKDKQEEEISNEYVEEISDEENMSSDSNSSSDGGMAQVISDLQESEEVMKWYMKVSSRRVDLVGDYAGNEMFLVEGDSMLLRCFTDPMLDMKHGFQMLHAAFIAESFLQGLLQRKCNFKIVFFDENKILSVPPNASAIEQQKYLLARAAIIRHLENNLMIDSADDMIYQFPSVLSPEFRAFLQNQGMYFIMCHDGADSSLKRNGSTETPKSESLQDHVIANRTIISFFMRQGYNVALVNGLEWQDTKVMTMVLESSSRIVPRFELSLPQIIQEETPDHFDEVIAEIMPDLKQHVNSRQDLSEREVLTITTVKTLLSKSKTKTSDIDNYSIRLLRHTALLRHLPLLDRSLALTKANASTRHFLSMFTNCARQILEDGRCLGSFQETQPLCDIADLVDGRLFYACSDGAIEDDFAIQPASPPARRFELLLKLAGLNSLPEVKPLERMSSRISALLNDGAVTLLGTSNSVLPFSDAVFDRHLESIRLHVDDSVGDDPLDSSARIFRELSHWHNSKKPLVNLRPSAAPSDKRREAWERKRNQWFLSDMHKYAESLNNASGTGLEPERVGIAKPVQERPTERPEAAQQSKKSHGGGKKTQQKNAKKMEMIKSIAENKAKQDDENAEKIMAAWRTKCRAINDTSELQTRYTLAQEYLNGLPEFKRNVVWAEIEVFMINSLLTLWINHCRNKSKGDGSSIAALIFDRTRRLAQHQESMSKVIATKANETIKALKLPIGPLKGTVAGRELPFEFVLPRLKSEDLSIPLSPKEFQLKYCGPYMDRDIDAKPDERVQRFEPDKWQRNVLDGIDAKQSLLVIAPTSAGKTFISFYAMKQILQEDDDGVLVYIAPTKALVNQIAAEIQARFKKDFQYAGKSVWAIHTRDYRINNPTGCQVLVTVPHVLQIMLLSPSNARTWSGRVRRIIFDEVHSIGQADDGLVWEQLLLLAPCPIIALSATIGNPQAFSSWLESTQKALGHELVMIQHPYRYSDLRKFVYDAPENFRFQGLEDNTAAFGRLGLDGASEFSFLHPVASLVNKARGLPDDLHLEPRDCLLLWQAMKRHQIHNGKRWIADELVDPSETLPEIIRKIDVIEWEKKLKKTLREWMADSTSPFDVVLRELSRPLDRSDPVKPQKLTETTLPLMNSLHECDALPALFFNYSRYECELIAQAVLAQLQSAEESYKMTSKIWLKKVKDKEQLEEANAKIKAAKANTKKATKGKKRQGGDNDNDDEPNSKSQLQQDAASAEANPLLYFDPDAPIDKFSFANNKKISKQELSEYCRQLRQRGVKEWLLAALERGIGVHHAGMNRGYRQVVEMLFRKGFLRAVIATGTLALGINMPTRTVVFSGDSVFLTALNFRQAAGRAGRRGFDVLGNVVFQGISTYKVCRLISSRLPDLNGHFPITTSLVLRLFTLLHESNRSHYAKKAIDSLLSQPRLYLGSSERKAEVLHHLRFSIEYLRRQHLLGADGAPLNFAGCVSHLYFTENSSFAFHALLKAGYFHELGSRMHTNKTRILEILMLVMSHIFGRQKCRQADQEFIDQVVKKSPSLVFLPKLPSAASDVLRKHNTETLDIYTNYVKTFVEQHIKEPEATLPLSGLKVGGDDNTVQVDDRIKLPSPKIRSAFVALSGHGDNFQSISDLCRTTRQGVWLEEAVVPHVDIYPEETETPLNAYLYDFYRHGDIHALEKANGVRKGDAWFVLNDFSLVLATIVTSLQNFLKLTKKSEMDMLDMKGIVDLKDEETDNVVVAAADDESSQGKDMAGYGVSKMQAVAKGVSASTVVAKKPKAKKVADSWDVVSSDEEEAKTATLTIATAQSNVPSTPSSNMTEWDLPAWEEDDGDNNGLLLVLKAFQLLKHEFDNKFRAIWA